MIGLDIYVYLFACIYILSFIEIRLLNFAV
jgi:hypothetical protein